MDLPYEEESNYKLSIEIVIVSFIIYIIGSVFLFLVLMNFLIAVICDAYN